MADDQVDISGMPEPSEIGLDPAKQSDPASDMPSPKDLYIQHHMYDGPTYMNPSQGDLDAFMKNPPEKPHKYTAGEFASAATGLPRVASVYNPVTPIVAGAAGALNALPAVIGAGLDPEHASEHLDTARERLRSGAKGVYDLAQYLPSKIATKRGNEMAEDAMDLPVGAAKETFEPLARRVMGDNATQAVGDVLSDAATALPGLGIKGVAKGAFKAGERVASAVKGAPKVAPEAPITPDVGSPVTGDALRSQPNPIPPPEGTVAHEKTKVPPRRGVVTNPPESQPAAAHAPENAPNAPENAPNAPENTPPNPTLPESDNAPLDMSLSPDQRAIVREGVAARRRSTDDQRGSVRLFNEPAKEGPQGQSETAPDERTGHLDELDKLSGGGLPSRRSSAIAGDYNATGRDFQMKEVGNTQMVDQLKTENAALHKGAENVHQSIGSEFDNSVDPQTLEDRGRVTRTALQGIEKHFGDMTDATYDEARAVHGHSPMPQFLDRASDFLGDEGNYMPDGFRRAAQARLNQLKTKGDNGNGTPNSGAAPSSVGAAEKFREWLNANRTMDNAHVVKQLKDHTDTDVSSQGGAGLFEKARHMRTHQAQMLEEPTLMRQLLTANDSQGINHQVATGKVMDKIADAPTEQVQHLMKVLHAGAHLSPELAESSAAAIREIQAHIVSRAHKAATNADGTWNSRTFYNAASKYGPKMDSVFKDRPDVKKNLKTLNDAGNTLSMDKHYPGAFGQEARTGAVGHIVEAGGKFASGLAHDIPFVGRIVGRAMENAVEGIGGKISESSRDKAVAKSLVDRNGKQRGAVGDLSQRDAVTHTEDRRVPTQIMHEYRTPNSGGLDAVESPELGFRQATMAHIPKNERGQGWGTRTLQRAVDDAHGAGQTWRSDKQVSDGQVGAYKNMMQLGYDVKMKPHEHLGGAYHAYGDHLFEVKPRAVKPPGQRGSFSFQNDNALNNATAAARNKQGGVGNERNPRTEYNANRQLAGNVKETAERVETLRRLSGQPLGAKIPGQRGAVGDLLKRGTGKISDLMEDAAEHMHGFDQDVMDKATELHDLLRSGIRTGRQVIKAGINKARDVAEDVGEHMAGFDQDVMDKASELQDAVERKVGIRGPSNQRGSVRVMNDAEEGNGSQLNVGLHQGTEGQKGFRKMSKQEAQAAVESTGAKVTKTSVLTPKQYGVMEPTAVMSTDRPLSNEEMQQVLAKTKQSAIPQRADNGDESMHIQPGHEETAAKEGWDTFNPDYFREHSGQTATEAAENPKNIHAGSTVRDAKRSAYPGIYEDPKDIASKVKTVPESPHLKSIFGTTRQEMHDAVIKQGDVAPKTPMPGMAPKGRGSAHAVQVTTPENAERIRNTISAFKDAHPDAYNGMVSWYHMDPMYHSIKDILGGDADRAGDVFHKLNTYTSLSSPMSSVEPEIRRGTAAATLAAEGKFSKYADYGGNPTSKSALKKVPEFKGLEMGVEGHAFHGTAQAPAMTRFHETGQEANAPKTGAYRRASDAPSRPGSEYQNTVLVGDSHFSRGAGLSDVRGAAKYDGSIDGTELKSIHPWYHENVAKPSKVPATSAQAVQWAALSHETGVETAIGAPKLEIWADQIANAAKRAAVSPKEMWRRIVKRLAAQ